LVIYLDELIAVNVISDYVILNVLCLICGIKKERSKLICAVLFGAVYCILTVFFNFSALVFKILAGLIMVIFVCGLCDRLFEITAVFFIISFLFGGLITFILEHFSFSALILVIMFAVIGKTLTRLFEKYVKRTEIKAFKTAEIETEHGSVNIRVYTDTGNLLKDPITGKKVIVVSYDAVNDLFNDGNFAKTAALDPINAITYETEKFHLVFYKDISGKERPLIVFTPNSLKIEGKICDDAVIGIGCDMEIGPFGCRAIMGDR